MFRYFVRRLLLAIPTLLIISLITFGLNKCAPKEKELETEMYSTGETSYEAQKATIIQKAARYGLDKPAFYFSILPASFPDTLYRVFPTAHRERLTDMLARTGNWGALCRYDVAVNRAWYAVRHAPDTMRGIQALRSSVSTLLSINRPDTLQPFLDRIRHQAGFNSALAPCIDSVQVNAQILALASGQHQKWIPAFHWYGLDNQYHRWLSGFVTGRLGLSRSTHKEVWAEIQPALRASLLINGLAMILAYLVGVPLGVALARRKNRQVDQWTRRLLLFLYSMPVFWLGGLLILLFATPDSGFFLINGISISPLQDSGKTLLSWFWENASKFILPVLTISLHMIALLSLQMRGGVLEVMHQDYIRTARAKGAGERRVYWVHAFRNALVPIITIFSGVFPAIFAGSLVVEGMFYYPGMGMKTIDAFGNADYPVIFAILMIASAMTIAGNLVADLLFAWSDPRIRFGSDR
jgi:peptide/nickel transport system permease protein